MGGLSARSKKKKRQNTIKRIILEPHFRIEHEKIQENLELAQRGINSLRQKPKNFFLHPEDPSAVLPQHVPEKILDTRVYKNPHAVLEYEERRAKNKYKQPDPREKVITREEEIEQELLKGMKGMGVDDQYDRPEEEDINDLVSAMGRLQIHEQVKNRRRRNKGGMAVESTGPSTWKDKVPKYSKGKAKAARHKRF